MWQSAATDSLTTTVQELFRGSTVQHYSIVSDAPYYIQGAQYFVWGILFLICFVLVFRDQTTAFLLWAADFLRHPFKRTYSDTSPAVRYGLPVGFVIMLPVAAYLLYGAGMVETPYLLILAVLAGYFLVRVLILRGISYVSGQEETVAVLVRGGYLFFMVLTAVYTIVFIIGMFLPDLYPFLMGPVCAVLSALLLLLYFIEQGRIFFAVKAPLLLTILYLCTLEIIPAATALVAVLRY